MTYHSFTVSQVAQQIGVSPSGVRRLCQEYAGQLSSGANPGGKAYRKFSPADLQVLQEIVNLKAQGLAPDAIKEQLTTLVFSAPITESPHAAQGSPGEAIAPLAVVVEAMRSATAPLESRLQALEQRQQATEDQRPTWRDVIIMVLFALVVGVMIGLSIWWFQ